MKGIPALPSLAITDQKLPEVGKNKDARLRGLDSIRFVCALIVVHNHLGNPDPLSLFGDVAWVRIANAIGSIFFFAPASVIIFFVLSGLCIHFPYRNNEVIQVKEFWIRRYIRLGIPLAVMTPLALSLGLNFKLFDDNILWSLFAELIYYTLYPALIRLKQKVGWPVLLTMTFVASLVMFAIKSGAAIYPAFGIKLNWLAGLFCWLLGVRLAESVDAVRELKSKSRIWMWRGLAQAGMSTALILQFHSPLKSPVALNVFAILVYYWLKEEIHYNSINRPNPWMERMGRISYSLYLVHLPVIYLGAYRLHINWGEWRWAGVFVSCVFVSWIFYTLIEAPSHQLSRRIRLAKRIGVPA